MTLQDTLVMVAGAGPTQRLLTYNDLAEFGIPYSRSHLWRLWCAGKFPKPLKLSSSLNAWTEAEVLAWLEAKIAERDGKSAA
jgi:prophage regulatory protein